MSNSVSNKKQNNTIRPICSECNRNYAAPNYWKNGIRHYRSKCDVCIKKKSDKKISVARWKLKGYTKKSQCELCKFRSRYSSQIVVHHVDGNLNNCELVNLRSICLNCVEVARRTTAWKIGDIQAD